MKRLLSQEFVMDWWLQKYHGITCQWLIKNEPELITTPEWYKKYEVTQAQHDEWYEWAIDMICKDRRCSRKCAKRVFAVESLNIAPDIKKTEDFGHNADQS